MIVSIDRQSIDGKIPAFFLPGLVGILQKTTSSASYGR